MLELELGGTGATAAEIDPAGIVRWGRPLSTTGVTWDPTKVQSQNEHVVQKLVYDSLVREQADGSLVPGLAEAVDIVNPQTLTVALRQGVTFSDGTPVDAAAVKANLDRVVASKAVAAYDPIFLNGVAGVDVTSPTALTIRLKTPTAGVVRWLLSRGEGMVIAPAALNALGGVVVNPIGAGPFTVERTNGTTSITLRKNATYFQADQIRLGGIEVLDLALGNAQVNALRAGQVDLINTVPVQSATELSAAPYASIVAVNPSRYPTFQLCQTEAPFNSEPVRQAMNYALDPDQINAVLFEGKGEVMDGMWPQGSRYYADVSPYDYDPDRAKALLAQAGVPNLTVTAVYASNDPTVVRFFEIAQQQYKAVGITLQPRATDNIVRDFFGAAQGTPRQGQLVALVQGTPGINKLTRQYTVGPIGNACNYSDPTLSATIAQVLATDPDSAAAVDLWHDAQQFIFNHTLNVFSVFLPDAMAYDAERVGGVEIAYEPFGALTPDFRQLYVLQR